MKILEHHHQWPLGGDHLKHTSYRPRRIGWARLTDTQNLCDPIADRRPVGLAGKTFAERRRAFLLK